MEEDKKENKKEKIYNTADLNRFLPVPFCFVSEKDLVVEGSESFLNLVNYDREEIKQLPVEDLFLEKEEIEDLFLEIKNEEAKGERELTMITKNEEVIPVDVVGSRRKEKSGYFLTLSSSGEEREKRRELKEKLSKKDKELKKKAKQMEDSRSALLNILEDVDKSYKEAEKERSKTVAIIENFVDGMLFFDADNRLTIINSKAEELFNIEAEEITKRNFKDLINCFALRPLVKFIQNEEEAIKNLFREELKMGEDLFLEITTTKIEEDDDRLGTLVHIHDITREKRIERIKSEFVSVAAHQLRTPLSGIKWTLETFLEEAVEEKDKLDDDEKMLIKKAYNANERMVRLVNDLLNVSRIEEGRYVYEPEVVDLYEILNPLIDEYREALKEKNDLELKVNKIKEKLPSVKIDKEKIMIVIQNFLDNAIKYTEKGEITLSIDMIEDKKIRISVQDEGVGIPEEQQERLFDKFFRAENVLRRDVEGSGLGLFIAKNIVEAHDGEIGFNSTEGEGSVFWFTLPISEKNKNDFFNSF